MGEAKRRKMSGNGPRRPKEIDPNNIRLIACPIDNSCLFQASAQAVVKSLDGENFAPMIGQAGTTFGSPHGVRLIPIHEFAQGLDLKYLHDSRAKAQNANAVIYSVINGGGYGGSRPVSNIFCHVNGDDFMYCVFTSSKAWMELPKEEQTSHIVMVCNQLSKQ